MSLAKYVSSPLSHEDWHKILQLLHKHDISRLAEIKITPSDIPSRPVTYKMTITAISPKWSDLVHATFNKKLMGGFMYCECLNGKFTDQTVPDDYPA
ncbi:MAG: hypothetical protein WC791_03295 [Candidatus Paceibacterota bacterium]|jgi:hypothetical protein